MGKLGGSLGGGKLGPKSVGKSKIPQMGVGDRQVGNMLDPNKLGNSNNMQLPNKSADLNGLMDKKVGGVQGSMLGGKMGGAQGNMPGAKPGGGMPSAKAGGGMPTGKGPNALNMASNAAKMGMGGISNGSQGGGQQGNNDSTVPDINENKGGAKNAAGKAANKASQANDRAKKVVDMAKKISKKTNSGAAKAGKAIGKVASKLGPALPYVAIAVVIIVVIVGICGFLATMPGMMTGKLKAMVQAVLNAWQSIYMSAATADVDKEDILDAASYIKDMGYDLIGYGFIPAKIIPGTGGAGSHFDKYGICYTATGDEKGAEGTFEVAGSVTELHEDVDTSVLELYLMSNNRLYTIRNYDWNDTMFERIMTVYHDLFVFNGIDYGKGILSLWHTSKDDRFVATRAYDKAEMGDISVNMETKEMEITKGWFNNPMKFKMDGWSGRYGLSLEFLLSLHLATMAPDLPKAMVRTFDTEVQVYLIEYTGAKITGYYKNDDGEFFNYEQMNEEDRNGGEDRGWDLIGALNIDGDDAFTIMKEFDIKSQEKGYFMCEYSLDFDTTYVEGDNGVKSENFSDWIKKYQKILTECSSHGDYYFQNMVWGRSGGGDEYESVVDSSDWEEFFDNSEERADAEVCLEDLGCYAIVEAAGVALEGVGKALSFVGLDGAAEEVLEASEELKEAAEKGGYNRKKFIELINAIDDAIDYVKDNYDDYIFFEQAETDPGSGRYELAEGDVSDYDNKIGRLSSSADVSDIAEVLEEHIMPFKEFKEIQGDGYELEIATFYEKGESEDTREKVRVSVIISRTGVDHNWDMGVLVYEIPSNKVIAESHEDVCSDHLDSSAPKNGMGYKTVCNACTNYIEAIRNSFFAINDSNYAGYAPAIARVVDSWFRDTYFIVPDTVDTAIQSVYNEASEGRKNNEYGSEILLTKGNIEYVEVDNEYLEETDEYWSKYELDGNGNYKLYLLDNDGTLMDSASDPKYVAEKSDDGEIIRYKRIEGSTGDLELDPKSEEARRLVKKPATQNISSAWKAYSLTTGGGESEKIPLQVKSDSNTNIKRVSNYISDDDYDERLYYTTTGIPEIEQIEDGRRGITNKTIKKMFKIRKYYIYDGTSEKAEAIYNDWNDLVNGSAGDDAFDEYGDDIIDIYNLSISSGFATSKTQAEVDAEVKELALEWAIDDLYYNNQGPFAGSGSPEENDPRDKSLIGNITINKDTLNAFSILENVDTIDSDYQYRDFKELIVELNYFDKEDLSDKAEEVFTWIMPEYTDKWPIRMIDKSEEYYGTLIHSAKSTAKLKSVRGVDGIDPSRSDLLVDLANSKGYTAGLEVVSPVTGKIVSYGEYERINTDIMENVDGATEASAKETVGYVQIKVLSEEEFPPDTTIKFFNSTNMPGQGTTEVDGDSFTKTYADVWNSYYEEYEDVCDGYYVTIDGIDISGIDFNNLVASTNIKPVTTPNLADNNKEKENQAIENIKADPSNPAFVKIGGETYIREGTIIGRTLDDTDYSYTRMILRDDTLAVEENVENYFDLPKTMMTNLGGVSVEFSGLSDNPSDQEKVRVAVTYLKSQGYTTEAACGILGNLIQESSLDPKEVTGDYKGLVQWHITNLWPGIYQWMNENGYNEDSFEGQLRALCESEASIKNVYSDMYPGAPTNFWSDLKALTNKEQATEAFCLYYERCDGGIDSPVYYSNSFVSGKKYQDLNKRKLWTENAYKIYMGNDTLAIKAGE